MKHAILCAVALVALAAAPAAGQYNDTAANNAAAAATTNADSDVAVSNVVDANAVEPAEAMPPAEPTVANAAPAPAPAPQPKSFPWGVLGLIGLIGLMGSRKGSS